MDGVGDGEQVLSQMRAAGDFGQHAAVGLFFAGDLRPAEGAGLRHGGVDEGELLSTDAEGWKVGGVFKSEGVNGFERSEQADDFLFHNYSPIIVSPSQKKRRLGGDYAKGETGGNQFLPEKGRSREGREDGKGAKAFPSHSSRSSRDSYPHKVKNRSPDGKNVRTDWKLARTERQIPRTDPKTSARKGKTPARSPKWPHGPADGPHEAENR